MEKWGTGRWGHGQRKVAREEGDRHGDQQASSAGGSIYQHSAFHV